MTDSSGAWRALWKLAHASTEMLEDHTLVRRTARNGLDAINSRACGCGWPEQQCAIKAWGNNPQDNTHLTCGERVHDKVKALVTGWNAAVDQEFSCSTEESNQLDKDLDYVLAYINALVRAGGGSL